MHSNCGYKYIKTFTVVNRHSTWKNHERKKNKRSKNNFVFIHFSFSSIYFLYCITLFFMGSSISSVDLNVLKNYRNLATYKTANLISIISRNFSAGLGIEPKLLSIFNWVCMTTTLSFFRLQIHKLIIRLRKYVASKSVIAVVFNISEFTLYIVLWCL